MSAHEWGIVIGVVTSALLALTPWMFMVHAKLAVLAARMSNLEDKADHLIAANESRLPACAVHEARLDTHDLQTDDIHQRLREIE